MKKERLYGIRTWKPVAFNDLMPGRKRGRIIGLTFPESSATLGLEPSVLTVLPDGPEVEYSLKNSDFNDGDVAYYLCSVYISGYHEFVRWAGRHDPAKIVVGGYHPTTFPEQFTRYAAKIVRGPCDDFYATIDQLGQVVDGIVNNQHLPRRDLYDLRHNQQIIPNKRPGDLVVSINTSVGCSMKPPCEFCCTPVMCPRLLSRPLEYVERELDQLAERAPDFCFLRDENFTMQPDWRERITLIHRYLPGTKLYLFASANTLREDGVKHLAANGVYMVCLGLEDPTVDYKKNAKLDEVVTLLKKHGIMTYLSFIVNPLAIVGQEAGKAFYAKLQERFCALAPEMVCGNFLMPFPGTGLWDKYYHLVSEADWRHYDSKTPFLVKNEVVRDKMRFFMFWAQWRYYTSDFYRDKVRRFDVGDTLYLRFQELEVQFRELYERLWDVRA